MPWYFTIMIVAAAMLAGTILFDREVYASSENAWTAALLFAIAIIGWIVSVSLI